MDVWRARQDAIAYLEQKQPAKLATLHEIISRVDQCVDEYEAKSASDSYAQICGLTLLKAKNLAVGAYSLILDGLGQEAGALLRPMIEYAELLTYFRKFPHMVERAAENELPKAGERAKVINGIYKEFRAHLNVHASHSSYSHYSLSHLLTPDTFQFKKLQVTVPSVLERNVRDFAVQLFLLLVEGVRGLEVIRPANFEELAGNTDSLKDRVLKVFID